MEIKFFFIFNEFLVWVYTWSKGCTLFRISYVPSLASCCMPISASFFLFAAFV